MVDMIRKVIDTEVKEISDRVLEFIGSTETQDRDGEIIMADGWGLKNYKKNPVFMWAHDYRQPSIGKALSVGVREGKLKFKIEFADEDTYPFADTIYKLYKGGFMHATSVGFIPKEWEDGDGAKAPRRTYKKQELLELSGVPVPSNPDALRLAVDDGVITTKEFEALTKPEETDDWIRIPIRECKVTATIDISKKEGIQALYCGKEKQVKTYLFDKRPPYNWTMARAKKWVEEHKSPDEEEGVTAIIEDEAEALSANITADSTLVVTQAEIGDELDYVVNLIESRGMNEEVKAEAWELVREVMRLTGDDIPDDIAEKVGAVLNEKNRDRLNQIKNIAQQILDSAGKPEEPEDDKETEPEITIEKVIEIVKVTVAEVIAKAQGKVD